MDMSPLPMETPGEALSFPKRIRLRGRDEVDRVFREGRYRRLGILHAKTLATDRREARFLISVKKKIGHAPTRNRIKRLVREAVRLNRKQLSRPHDICLFMTRTPPGRLSLSVVEAEIRGLIHHLNQSPSKGSERPWGNSSSG